MKTMKKIALAVILLIAVSMAWSCGKDGGAPDIYVPDINGNWQNQANSNDIYSFFDAPANAGTGTFDGNEHVSGASTGALNGSGSYTHSKVSFTVTYNDNSTTAFSGTISGSTNPTMVLSSAKGKLTLIKQ